MKLGRKKNLPDCLGPKLLRQKKFIGSILGKREKESQGKTPLFVCEKVGREQTEKRISFAKDHLGHD
jgi:hypothetical protein